MHTQAYVLGISALVALAVAFAANPTGNAASGAKLYTGYCQSCHGAGAVGVKNLGPVLKGEVAGWKFDLFKRAVLTGVDDVGKTLSPAMPRWGQQGFQGKKPTDQQLMDLQAYLKGLK